MIIRSKQRLLFWLCITGFCLTAPASFASDGYYKWVDERGNPQHSDRPPPGGIAYEFISTDSGMKRRVSASANSGSSPASAMPAAKQQPTSTVAEEQSRIKKNPAYCDQAKANLDTLNSAARVRIRGTDGEIRYLTEEEKDIQRKKANDMIAVHCN